MGDKADADSRQVEAMTEDEYRERILEIESHYDLQVARYGSTRWGTWQARWTGSMYLPDAMECIEYLTSVVEADYYDFPAPDAPNAWTARELSRWRQIWSHRSKGNDPS